MQHEFFAVVIRLLKVCVHCIYGRPEQGVQVPILRAMRMHFHEHPLRTTLDVDSAVNPGVNACRTGRLP